MSCDSYLLTPGTSYTLYALKDGGSNVETVHSFTTDVFVQDAIPLTSGYINDPAMGGEYSYNMSDGILVLPVSLFHDADKIYELLYPPLSPFTRHKFNSGNLESPQVNTTAAVLIPSHFSDGTHSYLPINGKNIIGHFVIIPYSQLIDSNNLELRNTLPYTELPHNHHTRSIRGWERRIGIQFETRRTGCRAPEVMPMKPIKQSG